MSINSSRINASARASSTTLTGSASADTLTGTAFNDTITGGGDADILKGNVGTNTFVFTTAIDSLAAAADMIVDIMKHRSLA